MGDLPTGTVTLVFSDIEGSTLLLSRLGPAYAHALDGQRKVLRDAWSTHGGTELGTEGDSFYVVFPTAPAAVAAVTQAQRELAGYPWPGQETVRVRIGVHSGNPAVHDGAYVGMDVHRAARIAGTAHGGQVVVSEATARLAQAGLPDGVQLRDLGSHHLKDIAAPEHIFQLIIDGLRADFPPLKTLGAASSLPVPTTPLVGRKGELAELTALLRSPGVRLVTLTGPGGSGKTRLAIGVAQQLVDAFPDGVYFVPLAAVTAAEMMWTSLAEALDVPPEARIPPSLFAHVAHRRALLVLDNLEQLGGADDVASELLGRAPHMVVVATSRRPLNISGELQHAVPPLELPEDPSIEDAQRSGAVQLFVHHARAVKATFTLNLSNVADVVAICHRLDGLPLAIELAATRIKLLSPHALLARLDTALDIAASGSRGPSRQKTLRDTIAWSYDLLSAQLQMFFRWLGVFAGGADLDSIAAVTDDFLNGGDPLDLVADLVDASLVIITETADGEPRVEMLETIRAFALDQLTTTGELDAARSRHAHHYAGVAEMIKPLLDGARHASARERFESELDNLREALGWALTPKAATQAAARPQVGLRLSMALPGFWSASGYVSEGRRWLELALEQASGDDSPALARCLQALADALEILGDLDRAHRYAMSSVRMWRRLNETSGQAKSLVTLAYIELNRGQTDSARTLYEEALSIARESGDTGQLYSVLADFARFQGYVEHNYSASLELQSEVLGIAQERGDPTGVLVAQNNIAATLQEMGRIDEAKQLLEGIVPDVIDLRHPRFLVTFAESYSAVLAYLGQDHAAVQLLGAIDAMREQLGTPRNAVNEAEMSASISKTRAALPAGVWNAAYQAGLNTTVEAALIQAGAPDLPASIDG